MFKNVHFRCKSIRNLISIFKQISRICYQTSFVGLTYDNIHRNHNNHPLPYPAQAFLVILSPGGCLASPSNSNTFVLASIKRKPGTLVGLLTTTHARKITSYFLK